MKCHRGPYFSSWNPSSVVHGLHLASDLGWYTCSTNLHRTLAPLRLSDRTIGVGLGVSHELDFPEVGLTTGPQVNEDNVGNISRQAVGRTSYGHRTVGAFVFGTEPEAAHRHQLGECSDKIVVTTLEAIVLHLHGSP